MKRPKRHQSKSQQKINSLSDSLRTCRKMCGEAIREGLNYKWMLNKAERRIDELTRTIQRSKAQSETCQRIIEAATRMEFFRSGENIYGIQLKFDCHFMGNVSRFTEYKRYVAKTVSVEVERMIATGKFMDSIQEAERKQHIESTRRAYQSGVQDGD